MTATRIIDDHLELANIGTNSHAQIDTHIAAADDYVKRDGSLALTSDWDIGDTRKVLADEIRARDGAGLKLYDDGGKGIFVKDGGYIGVGTDAPNNLLDIRGTTNDGANLLSFIQSGTGRAGYFYRSVDYSARPVISISQESQWGGTQAVLAVHQKDSDEIALGVGASGGLGVYNTVVLGDGDVGIGTTAPTAKLDINSDILRLRTAKTPASAGAAGNTGDMGADANYIYRCVSTNSWKRAALSVW